MAGATVELHFADPDDVSPTYESLLEQQRDAKGAVGGDLEYRYKALTARFALEYRREFGEPIPAAPDRGDADSDDPCSPARTADPVGIGMWSMIHAVFVQCGYDWYDETDACLRMMRNRLKSIAHYRGDAAARAEYERLRDAWDAHEAALEAWLAENPTGAGSEP